jgi:hypothetical protein
MSTYVNSTISFLRTQQHESFINAKLNLGNKLYFVTRTIPPCKDKIQCLIDTGVVNSPLHADIANKLNLTGQPSAVQLTTTDSSNTAVTRTAHVKFIFSSPSPAP